MDGFSVHTETPKLVKNKAKTRSTVVPHPIFLKLKKVLEDEYWISFFDGLAHNKFPRGFSFYLGSLYFKKGAKSFKIGIDETLSPEELSSQIIEFFHIHGSRYSPDEEKRMQENEPEEEFELEWKKLKKAEKVALRDRYIERMCEEWELCDEEKEYFNEIICEGLDNGQIKSCRVRLLASDIDTIDEVDFDEETRTFDIKLTAKRVTKQTIRQKQDPVVKAWTDAIVKKIKMIS
jgi:hypothetical protein